MTVAEATPDYEVGPPDDRAFLGHPKGLGFLGFTEACERFSYYSMQTLLVLYMVNYLLLHGRMDKVIGLRWLQAHVYHGLAGQPLASAIFGTYTALVYGTPILGGIIADKWLGRNDDSDHRRYHDGARPFPDGGRAGLHLRAASRFCSESAPSRATSRRKVGALYGPNDLTARDGVPDLLHLHQRQRDHRATDLRNARPESRLALRLRVRRRGDGDRPLHLPLRSQISSRRGTRLAQRGRGLEGAAVARRLEARRLPPNPIPVLAVALLTNQEIFNAYLVWGDQQFDLTLLNIRAAG